MKNADELAVKRLARAAIDPQRPESVRLFALELLRQWVRDLAK